MFRKPLVPRVNIPGIKSLHRITWRPRHHALSLGLGVLSLMLFWGTLRQLSSLSLEDGRYSHILVMPVISACILLLERRKVFGKIQFDFRSGLPLLLGSLVLYEVVSQQVVRLGDQYTLSITVLAALFVWVSGFALCYGMRALAAARFPFLLLLLIVPIPFGVMYRLVSVLQRGSAEVSYAFFKLAGVPMFKDGVRLELPSIGIEVAAECSSIHSAWALLITGLILAHMFLRLIKSKICLGIMTVPVAVFTNAVRIVTLWYLATHVDPGFLTGNLHHRGGILFSLLSLSILVGFLALLRKIEGKSHSGASPSTARFHLVAPAGGQSAIFP